MLTNVTFIESVTVCFYFTCGNKQINNGNILLGAHWETFTHLVCSVLVCTVRCGLVSVCHFHDISINIRCIVDVHCSVATRGVNKSHIADWPHGGCSGFDGELLKAGLKLCEIRFKTQPERKQQSVTGNLPRNLTVYDKKSRSSICAACALKIKLPKRGWWE